MRTLFFILFFVLGFCYIQARGQKPAHVIITAGQSNTDGRVPNNRLPDYIKAMAVDSKDTAGGHKNADQYVYCGSLQILPYCP